MITGTQKSTTRAIKGFIVTTQHRYRERTPETATWLRSPTGLLLATGLWTGHLDPDVVAGSQIDAWIDAAQFDAHIGCGWMLDDREC